MSEVQSLNNDQILIKKSLLSLADKIKAEASNGHNVSSLQLHGYLKRLQALLPDPPKKTLADEVREWVLSSDGVFESSDVARELALSSRVDRQNLSKILERMKAENLIVRHGDKRGRFRRVDPNLIPMNWEEASIDNTVNLVLPLGFHKLMHLYPKNIIVIAGDTNAGKTAYLLNLVRENAERFKIDYFTNDLTPEELKRRVQRFNEAGMATEAFSACNFIERAENYLDIINPDGITIIDYLELTDKFWLVGKEISDIYKHLKGGIAIVAIQKDTKAARGRGGDFGAEKARLYFALERGKVKMIKMKNLKDPDKDPNGKFFKFNLWGGCKFIPKGGWQSAVKACLAWFMFDLSDLDFILFGMKGFIHHSHLTYLINHLHLFARTLI